MVLEEKLPELEGEKQEIREFIELFRTMPKERHSDIKYIMIGVNLVNRCQENKQVI